MYAIKEVDKLHPDNSNEFLSGTEQNYLNQQSDS